MEFHLPLVTAHSGCEDTPENSLESLLAGIDAGADVAEVDVRSSTGGIPILMHDKVPPEAETPSDVIALDTALDLIRSGGIMLILDLKDDECIDVAVGLVRQRDLAGRVIVSGCGPARASLVRTLAPELPVLLNIGVPADDLSDDLYAVFFADACRSAIERGCCGINVDFRACRPPLVAYAHKHYLPVSVWTVEQEHDMRRMIGMGVHSIMDLPRFCGQVIWLRLPNPGGYLDTTSSRETQPRPSSWLVLGGH